MKRVAIITSSDTGYRGEREDLSGPAIKEIVEREGYEVVSMDILPDDQVMLAGKMQEIADKEMAELILTTGGTGFSERDVTPEATEEVIERRVPGIPEAMRAYSMTITKRAMLSRATAGIRGKTLIINLPGSPKAVKESLEYIIDALGHGIEILTGEAGNCARNALCAANVCWLFPISKQFLRFGSDGNFHCSSAGDPIEHWLFLRAPL